MLKNDAVTAGKMKKQKHNDVDHCEALLGSKIFEIVSSLAKHGAYLHPCKYQESLTP